MIKRIFIMVLALILIASVRVENGDKVMATKTIYVSEDSYAEQCNPGVIYGSDTRISFGHMTDNAIRSYLKFNDLGQIPDRAIIKSATWHYQMILSTTYGAPSINANFYVVTGTWSESSLRWNVQPAVSATPSISNMAFYDTETGWQTKNVTALVRAMKQSGSVSFMLRPSNESGDNCRFIFNARETGSPSYLVIDYELPIEIAPSAGGMSKTVQNIMIAPSAGAINKNVKSAFVHSGTAWEKVF